MWPIFIILLGVLAYSNTLDVPFIFDDHINIVQNPAMRDWGYFLEPSRYEEETYGALSRIFRTRMFGYFTFALNYAMGGFDTTGYHLTNIAIHIITALLIYRLVLLTFKAPSMQGTGSTDMAQWAAFFTASFFVVHPIQTQAVTYIVQRFASLSAMLYLACMVCYVESRYAQGSRASRYYYISSFVLALLAIKTKEIAFTIPIALALYEWVFFPGQLSKRIRTLAPYFMLLALIPLMLFGKGRGMSGDLDMVTLVAQRMPHDVYFLTELRVVATYLRLLVLPVGQSLDHEFALSHSIAEPAVLGALLLHASIIGSAAYLLRRQRHSPSAWGLLSAFGILWFYLNLFIESGAVPIADVIMEHRVYLPSAGAFMVLVSGACIVMQKNRLYGIIAFALIVGTLGAASYARNAVWVSNVEIWEDAASKSPNKWRPFMNIGAAYQNEQGDDEKAETYYTKAYSLDRSVMETNYNLGRLYYKKGRYLEAEALLKEAARINPVDVDTLNILGSTYFQMEMYDDAIANYMAILKRMPRNARAHNNLGSAYLKIDRRDDALREFREALRIKPDYAEAKQNLEDALSGNTPPRSAQPKHVTPFGVQLPLGLSTP